MRNHGCSRFPKVRRKSECRSHPHPKMRAGLVLHAQDGRTARYDVDTFRRAPAGAISPALFADLRASPAACEGSAVLVCAPLSSFGVVVLEMSSTCRRYAASAHGCSICQSCPWQRQAVVKDPRRDHVGPSHGTVEKDKVGFK